MKAEFLTPLVITPYAEDRWFLDKPLKYATNYGGNHWVVTVPAHEFSTDLASIPWLFRPIIRKTADTHAAGVIHDYLCYRNNRFKEKGLDGITRSDCDKIFRECLIVAGTPAWKATTMYQAVRFFSWGFKR
jgi:hypothetical protein